MSDPVKLSVDLEDMRRIADTIYRAAHPKVNFTTDMEEMLKEANAITTESITNAYGLVMKILRDTPYSETKLKQ